MLSDTVSIPELIWTISSILGTFFTCRQLQRAAGDYLIVRRRRINSIREYAAITTFIIFGSWTYIQANFVIVGVIAMFTRNPAGKVSLIQWVLVADFLSISVLMAIFGYITDIRRRNLVIKIQSIEEGFDK